MDYSSYQGEYNNNTKEGIGIYTWPNRSNYQGEWKNNLPHGYGIYTYCDNRQYEGEWKDGKMNGIGFFKWNDGKKYLGMYENDKRNGFGIFVWKIPFRVYVGFWKEGRQSGYGKVVTSTKERYCYWKNARRDKDFGNKEEFYEEFRKNVEGSCLCYEKFLRMNIDEVISVIVDN
jgi:hypothetical protein